MFCHNTVLTPSKFINITRNTAATIDYFITNTVADTQFKSGII